MIVCLVIEAVLCIISTIHVMIALISFFSKRVMTSTSLGGCILSFLLFIMCAVGAYYFFFVIDLWEVSFLPILLHVCGIGILTVVHSDVWICFRERILWVSYGVRFRMRRYDEIVGYTIKRESGIVRSKYGEPHKVQQEVATIYFSDGRICEFGFDSEKSRKVKHLKALLLEKKCARNGRAKRKRA